MTTSGNCGGSNGEMPAVRTTIVGGRPPGSGKMIGDIPRGIEVLVKKASVDPRFRASLLKHRSRAAEEIGLALESSEAMMLDIVPQAQLEAIIARTKVEPSKMPAFLGKAAAVMLVALGASTASAQRAEVSEGVRPAPTPTAAPVPTSQPTSTSAPAEVTIQPLPQPAVPMAGAVVMPRPVPLPTPATQPATQPTTTSAPAVDPAEVTKLVTQLDSDKWAERKAAYDKLKSLGLPVVPLLRDSQAKYKDNVEVSTRLQELIQAGEATTRPAVPTPDPRMFNKNGIQAGRGGQKVVADDVKKAAQPAQAAQGQAQPHQAIVVAQVTATAGVRAQPLPLPIDPTTQPATAPATMPATTSAPAVDVAEVARLVAQLDSEKYAERADALKKLKALGLPAVPQLRLLQAKYKDNAEVTSRLAELIQAGEASTQPAPTPPPQMREMLGLRADLPVTKLSDTTPADQTASQPTTTSAPAVDAKEVAQLVEQLNSDKYAERVEANKKLKAIGLPALPALRDLQAKYKDNVEVNSRLQELIQAAEATTQPTPTPTPPGGIIFEKLGKNGNGSAADGKAQAAAAQVQVAQGPVLKVQAVAGAVVGLIPTPVPTSQPASQMATQPASAPASMPATSTAPADADAVAKLVAQLDSEKYAERKDAYDKLKALGLPVVPQLRQLQDKYKENLEVKTRLAELIQTGEATTQPTPTPYDTRLMRGVRADLPVEKD